MQMIPEGTRHSALHPAEEASRSSRTDSEGHNLNGPKIPMRDRDKQAKIMQHDYFADEDSEPVFKSYFQAD